MEINKSQDEIENYEAKTLIGNAPQELQAKFTQRREELIEKCRFELQSKASKTDFKYYCSVCLIIRDENEYLEEWLNWHIGQGVQHFYIYDHGSKYAVAKFVQSLNREIANKVTVVDWSGAHKNAQPDAYNDCLNRYRYESRWIGFIDADEQVNVKSGKKLPEFLKTYEEYAGLFIVWVTYGANKQIRKTSEPLRKRFTQISTAEAWPKKAGKVFVQPIFMEDMIIHSGGPCFGFEIVGENKDVVGKYMRTTERPSADLICLDHYYTKSYEEWLEKLRRGSGDTTYSRKYEEFFKCNPDMEYCREGIDIKQYYSVSTK